MKTASRRTKVLSIVGPGRSGTTVLSSILGEADGVMSAGELRWLWRRGLLERRPCGCGRPPAECPVWSQVLRRLAEADLDARTRDALSAQEELAARRHRVRLLRNTDDNLHRWVALKRLRAVTGDLLSALAEVTDADVVVDSSKRAQDAAVLGGIASIDHYLLHIVRDPRAVVYSWRRKKPVGASARTMGTRGLWPSALRWSENCASAELLHRSSNHDRWLFMRYEDFVAQPKASVEQILAFIDHAADVPFILDDTVELGPNHIVIGNPDRFKTGPVRIRADDEWRIAMSSADQMRVVAATFPFLRRYGYPMAPLGRQGRRGDSAT